METHDAASVRNLEQMREGSGAGNGIGRVATFALVVVSGVCVAFGASALGSKQGTGALEKKTDPLAELAKQATTANAGLNPGEVTFPSILSERTNPTTALAAAGSTTMPAELLAVAPAPGDKLPVVPLPARHALTTSPALGKPKDRLSALAEDATDAMPSQWNDKSDKGDRAGMASSGSEGGWQVQVSSFKTQAEADAFVNQLRARGHKAHVQVAEIPKRGTWYRVKIGPFSTQAEATRYRSTFEAKEKLPGFVVKSGTDPR
jgi:DedD protein